MILFKPRLIITPRNAENVFPRPQGQFLQVRSNSWATPQPLPSAADEEAARDDFRSNTTAFYLQQPRGLALPALFPGWHSQTHGTLPTEPFLLSRAAQPRLTLSQILSEPSRFLLPARCRRLSTGHTLAKFQDLNKVRRNRWANDLENQKGISAPQTPNIRSIK